MPPPPPPVLMLQLVLPRPGSDSTARRSTGSASQRRRRWSGPHSGWPLRQPGSSPARRPAHCCPNSAPSPPTPTAAGAGVGAPPGRRLSWLTLLRPFPEDLTFPPSPTCQKGCSVQGRGRRRSEMVAGARGGGVEMEETQAEPSVNVRGAHCHSGR